MPIQMFTRMTAISATLARVSHGIGVSMIPRFSSVTLIMPLSCSRIDRQVALPTISGISQGSRSSARSTPFSGKVLVEEQGQQHPDHELPDDRADREQRGVDQRLAEELRRSRP